MSKKKDQNVSFMVRFTQQIFENDGDSDIQWRGKISHVQGEDEKRFTDFNDALIFMQQKLAELTQETTKDQSKEEQESILEKGFAMWQTMKEVGPEFVKETIKNPKKQFSQIQESIQGQFEYLGEEISEKVQFDQWRKATRADYFKLQESLDALASEIQKLHKKIDQSGE